MSTVPVVKNRKLANELVRKIVDHFLETGEMSITAARENLVISLEVLQSREVHEADGTVTTYDV